MQSKSFEKMIEKIINKKAEKVCSKKRGFGENIQSVLVPSKRITAPFVLLLNMDVKKDALGMKMQTALKGVTT